MNWQFQKYIIDHNCHWLQPPLQTWITRRINYIVVIPSNSTFLVNKHVLHQVPPTPGRRDRDLRRRKEEESQAPLTKEEQLVLTLGKTDLYVCWHKLTNSFGFDWHGHGPSWWNWCGFHLFCPAFWSPLEAKPGTCHCCLGYSVKLKKNDCRNLTFKWVSIMMKKNEKIDVNHEICENFQLPKSGNLDPLNQYFVQN